MTTPTERYQKREQLIKKEEFDFPTDEDYCGRVQAHINKMYYLGGDHLNDISRYIDLLRENCPDWEKKKNIAVGKGLIAPMDHLDKMKQLQEMDHLDKMKQLQEMDHLEKMKQLQSQGSAAQGSAAGGSHRRRHKKSAKKSNKSAKKSKKSKKSKSRRH
jgi:hypothetical protein